MTQAYTAPALTFINETFTGDVTTASTLTVAATDCLHVYGWSLTVTGNTAACPIQLKGSTTGIYAATRIELHGTLAATGFGAQPTSIWTVVLNSPIILVAGEELTIGGGATAGKLDGVVNCRALQATY